jgi:hypothetical protein
MSMVIAGSLIFALGVVVGFICGVIGMIGK